MDVQHWYHVSTNLQYLFIIIQYTYLWCHWEICHHKQRGRLLVWWGVWKWGDLASQMVGWLLLQLSDYDGTKVSFSAWTNGPACMVTPCSAAIWWSLCWLYCKWMLSALQIVTIQCVCIAIWQIKLFNWYVLSIH